MIVIDSGPFFLSKHIHVIGNYLCFVAMHQKGVTKMYEFLLVRIYGNMVLAMELVQKEM